jgi:hypothetical protein
MDAPDDPQSFIGKIHGRADFEAMAKRAVSVYIAAKLPVQCCKTD